MTTLREGDKQIPVMARLRLNQRARLDDVNNLYVYPSMANKACLSVRSRAWTIVSEAKSSPGATSSAPSRSLQPREEGVLASEVMALARPKLLRR